MKKIIVSAKMLPYLMEDTTTISLAAPQNNASQALLNGQSDIKNARTTFGGNVTAEITPKDGPGETTITVPNASNGEGGAQEALKANNTEVQKALNNGMNVGVDVTEHKSYTKKQVEEARLRKMRAEGRVMTKKELAESILRENNAKKKLIRQLYKVITPYTSHLFRDDAWQGVGDMFKAVKELPFVTDMYAEAPNGGYHSTEDKMGHWKEYLVTIETSEGIDIKGTLNCHAAGTVEEPFSAYDMTFTLY